MKRFAIAALTLAAACWLTSIVVFVDETEFGFRTRLGMPVGGASDRPGVIDEPGLCWKWPWPLERVRRFDRRLQIYEPPSLERMTRDKKPLTVGSYVCWRITDPNRFFRTMGTIDDANRRLEEQLSDKLSAAVGGRDLTQLVAVPGGDADQRPSAIEPMMDELTHRLRERAEDFGIEVVDVQLRRFNHPAEVRPAIYERIRSERNRDAVRYRSEGDSEAEKIRSQAEDFTRAKILAEAEAQAAVIRGTADADKTRILNEAHDKNPEFYELVRTLEAYRKILDEKTTLVLSTDNAIFRLLTEKLSPTIAPGSAAPITGGGGGPGPAGTNGNGLPAPGGGKP